MRLEVKLIPLHIANEYIAKHHSHPCRAHRYQFSLGCYVGELLVGVVVVDRPNARHLDDGWTLELTRVCADRHSNVASKLIEAATRGAFLMGARYVFSCTPATEDGASYRAAGWRRMEAGGVPCEFGGGEWSRPSRVHDPMPTERKHRWERYNSDARDEVARKAG